MLTRNTVSSLVAFTFLACSETGTRPGQAEGDPLRDGGLGASDGQAPTGDGDGDGDGNPPIGRAMTSYEAEEAFHAGTGAVASSLPEFSGSGYVDGLAQAGARLIFAVHAAADGATPVALFYRSQADKTLAVHVNGSKVGDVTLPAHEDFAGDVQSLTLRRGLNTIMFVAASSEGGSLSVDVLKVANDAPRPARGALVPFVELEAEAGQGTATAVGPDTTAGSLASNASGRRAVTLDAPGKYVEWTLSEDANAISLRHSLPDASSGGGTRGTVSVYVDGQKRKTLSLSSRDAWLYGGYPFANDPAQGGALRQFCEDRFVLGELPRGAKLRLQRDADDTGNLTVDLVDVELAPAPYPRPDGSVSISEHGALAADGHDDAQALRDAIADARANGKIVWIPEGEFELHSGVDVEHVTIRGAGPWHSSLHGKDGQGGFNGTGDAVQLLDFAIFGDMDHRDDAAYASGVDGVLGAGSLLQNLWIEGTKVGVWLKAAAGAYVVGLRIRDTYADGVNINRDVVDSAVEHVHVRNTGDDAFAIWSQAGGSARNNRFKFDSAHLPYHASAFAIYGGQGHAIEDCSAADTVRNGAGIQLAMRHDPAAFSGTTRVERCTLARTGGQDLPNDWSFGAFWLVSEQGVIDAPIVLRDVEVYDSPFAALQFSGSNAIQQVTIESMKLSGAGGHGIDIATPGSATLSKVEVTGAQAGAAEVSAAFTITRGEGNTGW